MIGLERSLQVKTCHYVCLMTGLKMILKVVDVASEWTVEDSDPSEYAVEDSELVVEYFDNLNHAAASESTPLNSCDMGMKWCERRSDVGTAGAPNTYMCDGHPHVSLNIILQAVTCVTCHLYSVLNFAYIIRCC